MRRAFLWKTYQYYGYRSYSVEKFPDLTTSVEVGKHKLTRPKPRLTAIEREALRRNTTESLIPDTLKQMEEDTEFVRAAAQLKEFGQANLTKEEKKQRKRALKGRGFPEFKAFLQQKVGPEAANMKKLAVEILQVNIGLYCNQACGHCHVESSPKRTETMTREVADRCLELFLSSPSTHTLDITGGAPELCPQFRHMVEKAAVPGRNIIDRCNLTALLEPGQEDTAEFLAKHNVQIVASLPCYSSKNVNLQRGRGVFEKSVAALLLLNQLGYGRPGTGLHLNLVYNPLGAFLPPDQEALEVKYKAELWEQFGIDFNSLFTITNMPIKRFMDFLVRRGELEEYMEVLVRNFNQETLDNLMCRNLVSVNYDGSVYDCDFNQQLSIPLLHGPDSSSRHGPTVFDIEHLSDVRGEVRTDNHCFGCTAGRGSS